MGCTSSAPSMAPANATGDMQDNQMEEMNNTINGVTKTNAIIENEVLPMCDNLAESKHLSQNDRSKKETVSQRIDKDVQTDSFRIDNALNEGFQIFQEDRVSKLEEVVEEAVEKLSQPNMRSENVSEGALVPPAEPIEVLIEMDHDADEAPADDGTEAIVEEDYEHLEALSPSQSESSRATRWEALADIAAELPPSLAVDPLTGQIYTLSK